MFGKTSKENSWALAVGVVARGTVYSFFITVCLSAILGLIYYLSSMSESTIPYISQALLFISILAGSAIGVKNAESRGLLHGIAIGIVTFLLVLVFAVIIFPDSLSFSGFLYKFASALIAGGLGGIMGISKQ